MRSRRMALALAMMAVAVGCRSPVESDRPGTRVTLNLHSLLATSAAAPGDLFSVLGSARLTIESAGGSATQTVPLGDSDSLVSFDLTADTGPTRFVVEVLSNIDTVLYRGEQTVTIDRDDFAVTITPQPVNAILVIEPRVPLVALSDNGVTRFATARWNVRNAGLTPQGPLLRWNVDSAASQGVVQCTVIYTNTDCFRAQFWNPPFIRDSIRVIFTGATALPLGNRTIRFTSNVGIATFTASLP